MNTYIEHSAFAKQSLQILLTKMGRHSNKPIWSRTSLMYSKPLSDLVDRCVYLKLENTQPSGSFKLRGISHLCKEKYAEGCTKLVGASGGNAGLALAYSAQELGIPCQIFVPKNVSPRIKNRLCSYGVTHVTLGGDDVQSSVDMALREVEKDPSYAFIHPYDHPTIWEGHSVIAEEIQEDLEGRKPACIVMSVGGGGMLMGILIGLERIGWKDVPILAMETEGCDCFNISLKAGRIIDVEPTSIAKTLGCRTPAPKLMERVQEFNIISQALPDKCAARGCIRLADDHGMMVEPACGVTLASVYSKVLPQILDQHEFDSKSGPIVLIVCGGSDMTVETLLNYKQKYM